MLKFYKRRGLRLVVKSFYRKKAYAVRLLRQQKGLRVFTLKKIKVSGMLFGEDRVRANWRSLWE